jgi:hypothetical protein
LSGSVGRLLIGSMVSFVLCKLVQMMLRLVKALSQPSVCKLVFLFDLDSGPLVLT